MNLLQYIKELPLLIVTALCALEAEAADLVCRFPGARGGLLALGAE